MNQPKWRLGVGHHQGPRAPYLVTSHFGRLSTREFALLQTFLRRPGQVLSRQQLLSAAWGLDFDPGSNIVDVYVPNLRGKLGAEALETVRGSGYRLV